MPESETGRITDSLVGVGAVLSPAGLLAGGGALPLDDLLAPLLHHCLVLGRTLSTRGQKKEVTTMNRSICISRFSWNEVKWFGGMSATTRTKITD